MGNVNNSMGENENRKRLAGDESDRAGVGCGLCDII